MESLTEVVPERRLRMGRKRRFRVIPRPALPVRGLWEAASAEERAAAHRACLAILEWWVGRRTRASVAAELGVTGLRAWQLSQSALSGMLAGLLRQPRRRGRAAMRAVLDDTRQDLAALKKENADLKRRLGIAERLIGLLRGLPGSPVTPAVTDSPTQAGPAASRPAGEKRRRARRRAAGSGDGAAAGGDAGAG